MIHLEVPHLGETRKVEELLADDRRGIFRNRESKGGSMFHRAWKGRSSRRLYLHKLCFC